MPPNKPAKLNDGEKVLCYHGPLLYEAKIIKSRVKAGNVASGDGVGAAGGGAGETQYLVHYQGWNKNWDEWVPDGRVLKITPDNNALKQRLMQEHTQTAGKEGKKKAAKKESAAAAASTNKSAATPPPPSPAAADSGGGSASSTRKQSESASTSRASTPVSERSAKLSSGRRRELADDSRSSGEDDGDGDEELPGAAAKNKKKSRRSSSSGTQTPAKGAQQPVREEVVLGSFNISLPDELRFVLRNDHDLISKRSLFSVPAKVAVSAICSDFLGSLDSRSAGGPARTGFYHELVENIQDCFDSKLGKDLLYRFERQQFVSACKAHPDRRARDLYGSAHLLRLLARLDGYLNLDLQGKLSKDDVETLESAVDSLLSFLEKNSHKYFTSKNYAEAEENYVKASSIAAQS